MKLLTQKIIENLPPLRSTRRIKLEDKKVICAFYHSDHFLSWYVFEGKKIGQGNYRFYGLLKAGKVTQLRYFTLFYLQGYRYFRGGEVKRDKKIFKKLYCDCR